MPNPDRKTCQACGGSAHTVGPISWGGYCAACGEIRAIDAMRQLRAHTGPVASHHRRRIVESFGGVLLDDVQERP